MTPERTIKERLADNGFSVAALPVGLELLYRRRIINAATGQTETVMRADQAVDWLEAGCPLPMPFAA